MLLPTPAPGSRPPALPSRRTAVIIWGALLAGVIGFSVVAAVAGPNVRRGATGEGLGQVLGAVAACMALTCLVVSIALPPRLRRFPAGTPPDGVALTRTIVASALNEGAALFAVVAWMVTGSPWPLAALAVSLAGLLLAFPSQGRWARLGGSVPGARQNRLVR